MLFAFARDGLLFRPLGRVHPRTHTPYVAILAYAAVALALALTGTFTELAVLAAMGTAGLYAVGCAAAWVLARRGVAKAGTPLSFRGLGVATVVGVAGMVALIASASWQEIVGLLVLVALSALVYLLQTRKVLA
jgi:amino acid transporter